MIVLYYKDFHTCNKNAFFLSIYFLLYENILLFLLSFFKIVKDPIEIIFYLFTFRPETNGNCLFSVFSIAMCGDKGYVNDLRILTAIELYANPGFYSQHSIFTLLLNNNPGVFDSIDTVLAISVSHNALDTNKTNRELVQREALNICSAYKWCGFLCALALSSVSLSTVQCYYKSSGSPLMFRLMFNQLIQPRLANYLSSEKIHLLFCSNLFEPPVPFSHNHYASLIMCRQKNTPNKKCKIPSASVSAPKSKKSTQQSSIKTFLKKDLTSTDSNWTGNTCGKYGNSSQHTYSISHGNSNPEQASCTSQGSYESISQHSNFSNPKSGRSFSDTSLIFSSPSKSFLTSKISDSSRCFKGPTLLHSKQSRNSNRVSASYCSYCNPGLPITKAIDVNTGKLSETFVPLSNSNRYDVATYKAKEPYPSDAEQKDI